MNYYSPSTYYMMVSKINPDMSVAWSKHFYGNYYYYQDNLLISRDESSVFNRNTSPDTTFLIEFASSDGSINRNYQV